MMADDEAKRTKPHDVAVAEAEACHQGMIAAGNMKRAFLMNRKTLLDLGFPVGHALCLELDDGAAKWAAHEEHMRRDGLAHAKENSLQ